MDRVKTISPFQFACFRIVFGSYLAIHFLQLLPYAGELFSSEGVLGYARLNFTFGVLPNPLEHFQSPGFAFGFVGALCVLSLAFAAGWFRRTAALLLWFGWACLFNRNNLILNPGLPYVGLLLLLCALLPPGEPLSVNRKNGTQRFKMPAMVYWSAWVLLAAGYSYSGFYKLFSPSWVDGSALMHVADNPLARPGIFRDLLLALPPGVLRGLTWLALAGELLALPLSFHRRGRMVAWLWMMSLHVGILLVVDFADLTFGMVMIHLFVFDPDWLPARKNAGGRIFLFDGACAFCHRTVQFLAAEDRGGVLHFAPLQGATAATIPRVVARNRSASFSHATAVLVEGFGTGEEKIYVKSDAILRALTALGGFWRIVGWLRWVPRSIRDAIYDVIAKNRYRWFGRKDSACLIPTEGMRGRIMA